MMVPSSLRGKAGGYPACCAMRDATIAEEIAEKLPAKALSSRHPGSFLSQVATSEYSMLSLIR